MGREFSEDELSTVDFILGNMPEFLCEILFICLIFSSFDSISHKDIFLGELFGENVLWG